MIVVDTNVLSEITRQRPDPVAADWFAAQPSEELHLCAPVLGELVFGAESFRIRHQSDKHYRALKVLRSEALAPTVLPFDDRAAVSFGELRAKQKSAGRSGLDADLMIAAICIIHGAILATRNTRDFDGLDLKLVNPFEART